MHASDMNLVSIKPEAVSNLEAMTAGRGDDADLGSCGQVDADDLQQQQAVRNALAQKYRTSKLVGVQHDMTGVAALNPLSSDVVRVRLSSATSASLRDTSTGSLSHRMGCVRDTSRTLWLM